MPVIALSQLSREVEKRTTVKRPQLSDLRESGAIEQDADIVCFIHRPEYYKITEDSQGNSLLGIAEIIVAKHRSGATDDVKLRFIGKNARFANLNERNTFDGMQPFSSGTVMSSKMNQMNNDFISDSAIHLPPPDNIPDALASDEVPF